MIIHFSILLLIIIVSAFYEHTFLVNKKTVIAGGGTASDYLGSIIPWLIVFGYIAFLAGMRSNVNDTYAYRDSFINLNASWDGIRGMIAGDAKDKGFTVLAMLFKMYVSKDYHFWFLFVAAIESMLIVNVLKREAVSFLDACLLFFVTALYFNYFSMMRQWIAVSIVFWGSRFIKSKKLFLFIILCVFAAQFHNSAYFMLFAYFIVTGKAWSKKQAIIIVSFTFAILFLQPILGTISSFSEDSTYSYVIDTMQTNSGSSLARIPIAAVPLVLAYIHRNRINADDPIINISINMTLINLLMITLASFTSGLFIGRMSNYTQVYTLILLPYLFNVVIEEKNKVSIKLGIYFMYFIFYILQMNVSGSFYYGSDILGYHI